MSRLAIVPARGGSKRIPEKNIVDFCGRPMICHALDALRDSGCFDEIHVSTDCPKIMEVVEHYGLPISLRRPPELANDFVGLQPVLKWVVDQFKHLGQEFDTICCMMPNAPLATSEDVRGACETFEAGNRSLPLLAFSKFPVPVEWAFRRHEGQVMRAESPEKLAVRSQDLGNAYYECGPFTFWTAEHLVQASPLADGVLSYVLPPDRAVDVDDLEDLEFARRLYQVRAD